MLETIFPRIAITPGEPAGIGPDLCIALAQQRHDAELVVVADPALLQARARQLGLPLNLETRSSAAAACNRHAQTIAARAP